MTAPITSYHTQTTGSVYDVQEFLRSVKYQCNNSQSITVLLSESLFRVMCTISPEQAHFYKYVPEAGLYWEDAYKAALNSEVGGWQGYLAVITSKEEDDFYKKYAAPVMEDILLLDGGNTF